MARSKSSLLLHIVFLAILFANFAFWTHSRKVISKWDNVPPAPSESSIRMTGLGDSEIAYRLSGYFLQNLGNVGGLFESLKLYDYAALEKWFFLTQGLDERANYVPFMAAYDFGAVEDSPDQIGHVVTYLADNGVKPYPQKWRWLAQAVYLARYKQNDLPKALELANTLAALKTDTAPWARQMPAFIQLKMGNKDAAYQIMMHMLSSEADKLPPQEINEMRDYICTRTLSKQEAAKNPLCQTPQ